MILTQTSKSPMGVTGGRGGSATWLACQVTPFGLRGELGYQHMMWACRTLGHQSEKMIPINGNETTNSILYSMNFPLSKLVDRMVGLCALNGPQLTTAPGSQEANLAFVPTFTPPLQMRRASLAILITHLVLLVVNTFSWSKYVREKLHRLLPLL